jgi:hypothetical protein
MHTSRGQDSSLGRQPRNTPCVHVCLSLSVCVCLCVFVCVRLERTRGSPEAAPAPLTRYQSRRVRTSTTGTSSGAREPAHRLRELIAPGIYTMKRAFQPILLAETQYQRGSLDDVLAAPFESLNPLRVR